MTPDQRAKYEEKKAKMDAQRQKGKLLKVSKK